MGRKSERRGVEGEAGEFGAETDPQRENLFENRWARLIGELEKDGLPHHLRERTQPLLLARRTLSVTSYVLYVCQGTRARPLSPMQDRLARYLAKGLGDKQAAFELGMSVHTVREHKRRIFDRLGIHSVSDLSTQLTLYDRDERASLAKMREPKKSLMEIRARADTLLAELLDKGNLGPTSAQVTRDSRAPDASRGPPPLAEAHREARQYILRSFLQPRRCSLTPREWEVAYLSACLLPSKEIADALGISWHTVRGHLTPTLVKLGAASREDLGLRLAACVRDVGPAKN